MKKSLSFMFIFFMLLTMISGLFLVQGNQKVSAWGTSTRDKSDNPLVYDEKVGLESIGRINANYDGSITIQYKYGFSELMIVATECSQYLDGDSNQITNGDVTKAVSCGDFGGAIKVIHVSGDYNRQASGNASKTIHLYNYVGLGKIVQVQMVFSFMKSKEGASDNTGLYYPLYCSVDNKTTNCKQSDSQSKSDITADARVRNFMSNMYGSSKQYDVSYFDRRYLVYQNEVPNPCSKDEQCTTAMRQQAPSSFTSLKDNAVQPKDYLYIQIGNSKMEGGSSEIESLVYDTIIPVLITILFIAAGVSIAVLGYKIVKSADEPQERRDKVVKLRNILIGIGIALLLLFAANPAVDFIKGIIEEK